MPCGQVRLTALQSCMIHTEDSPCRAIAQVPGELAAMPSCVLLSIWRCFAFLMRQPRELQPAHAVSFGGHTHVELVVIDSVVGKGGKAAGWSQAHLRKVEVMCWLVAPSV
jgi:hypothetical protein